MGSETDSLVDEALSAKKAYFQEQALLDLSDDEIKTPDVHANRIDEALKAMPPSRSFRQSNSFCGPTPKERRAGFEAHARTRRANGRLDEFTLPRSSTFNGKDSVTVETTPAVRHDNNGLNRKPLKRPISLPNLAEHQSIPFYKQIGAVPRELKNGKNTKLAENIKLDPEHKQVLHGKIVYFYPNDDISMARRTRIHKVIQLGAAWVKIWRDDITHIMIDDANHTYSQLLRHLNKPRLPVCSIVLLCFPKCLHYTTRRNEWL